MAKHHLLLSPFGEAHLDQGVNFAHIEATSGLAGDWALGWWHAHQAGDETIFSRAFWRGQLGISGKPSAGRTELDAFVGHWAFEADLDTEAANLSKEQRLRVQSYADGFNHARKRSSESPWTPADCHLLARTLGFLEWWETRAPQVAFLLQALDAGLSWPRILDLWPGLGLVPDRSLWKALRLPPRFSPEAQGFLNRLPRLRPSSAWIIPKSRSQTASPLLAASYLADVTTADRPFLAVRIDTPEGSLRGLSRPGHPGFLAGKTRWLSWHGTVAIDDSVNLRVLDRQGAPSLAGVWAGSGRTGTLLGLLSLEEATTAEMAQERTGTIGTACLDFAAVDSRGGSARWAQGPRWLRSTARDAWLPAAWGAEVPVGFRQPPPELDDPLGGKITVPKLEAFLTRAESDLVGDILPSVRFLLPDTEVGQKLRRWTGTPPRGLEAKTFEKLYEAILDVFWEDSPVVPDRRSAVFQALLPKIDELIRAPHSAWFPSTEKNLRLAEAVRRAFAPNRPAGFSSLGRRSAQPHWIEEHAGHTRTFGLVAAVVADPAVIEWRVLVAGEKTPFEFKSW